MHQCGRVALPWQHRPTIFAEMSVDLTIRFDHSDQQIATAVCRGPAGSGEDDRARQTCCCGINTDTQALATGYLYTNALGTPISKGQIWSAGFRKGLK